MSVLGINLLPQTKEYLTRKQLFKRLKKLGVISLIIFVMVFNITFSLSLILSRKEKSIRDEIATVEEKIKNLQKQEYLNISLKNRIKSISEILMEREDFSKIFKKIQSISPAGIVLEKIVVKGDLILITGKAQDTITTGEFLDGLNKAKNDFSSIVVTSLAKSKKGGYTFELEAMLIKTS